MSLRIDKFVSGQGQPFWDNERFKSYEEKRQCLGNSQYNNKTVNRRSRIGLSWSEEGK